MSFRRVLSGRNKGLVYEGVYDTTKTKTGSSAANQVRIVLSASNFAPLHINWGDGTEDYIPTYNSALLTHTYSVAGIYTVKIIGNTFSISQLNPAPTESNKLLRIERNGGLRFLTGVFGGYVNLTKIGDDVEFFNQITDGTNMFFDSGLTSLPADTKLNSLTIGNQMFVRTKLTLLPYGMTLNSLTNGNAMFAQNLFTDLPAGMKLSNLTVGSQMFIGVTLNTVRYSQLLNDLNTFNPNNNVNFHGGKSKYNSSASAARASLVARPWTITDGGLI